ncbi:MAG TPA: hypothetical protein VKB05_10980 [Pyrinomonadaceae bacterium]|nr:hypothetical protein [Pyrinomonadaceae bacterium]
MEKKCSRTSGAHGRDPARGVWRARVGIAVAAAVTRLLASFLYGVSTMDALTFTAIPALLTAVALLACYLPARRATRVEPLVALRYE